MSQRWKLSDHAHERIAEMGLTRRDVLGPLVDPVMDYPGSSRYAPGRRVAIRGRLAVVYEPHNRTVVTVLWHAEEARHLELTGAAV